MYSLTTTPEQKKDIFKVSDLTGFVALGAMSTLIPKKLQTLPPRLRHRVAEGVTTTVHTKKPRCVTLENNYKRQNSSDPHVRYQRDVVS